MFSYGQWSKNWDWSVTLVVSVVGDCLAIIRHIMFFLMSLFQISRTSTKHYRLLHGKIIRRKISRGHPRNYFSISLIIVETVRFLQDLQKISCFVISKLRKFQVIFSTPLIQKNITVPNNTSRNMEENIVSIKYKFSV